MDEHIVRRRIQSDRPKDQLLKRLGHDATSE